MMFLRTKNASEQILLNFIWIEPSTLFLERMNFTEKKN
jgi:hypothetical protein